MRTTRIQIKSTITLQSIHLNEATIEKIHIATNVGNRRCNTCVYA